MSVICALLFAYVNHVPSSLITVSTISTSLYIASNDGPHTKYLIIAITVVNDGGDHDTEAISPPTCRLHGASSSEIQRSIFGPGQYMGYCYNVSVYLGLTKSSRLLYLRGK